MRNVETYVEATYQYEVTPWWQIQPDFQYVFGPGAGVFDPLESGRVVEDEAVIGVRTNIVL